MTKVIKVAIVSRAELDFSSREENMALERVAERFCPCESLRISSIKNRASRLLSLGGLLALSELIESDRAEIVRSDLGKPYFTDSSNGYFSISHSGGLCVAAVYDEEIGIDLERVTEKKEIGRIAERFFSKREKLRFLERGESVDCFFEIWTEKEAYVKYLGGAFSELYSREADGVAFKRVTLEYLGERYLLTLCSKDSFDYEIKTLDQTIRIIKEEK